MAMISISRGTFSGGKILAERLAGRLGYPCLGREEVLMEAGIEYGVSERELTEAVNQPPPFWQQVPGRRVAYLMCLTATLLKHAGIDFMMIGCNGASAPLKMPWLFWQGRPREAQGTPGVRRAGRPPRPP